MNETQYLFKKVKYRVRNLLWRLSTAVSVLFKGRLLFETENFKVRLEITYPGDKIDEDFILKIVGRDEEAEVFYYENWRHNWKEDILNISSYKEDFPRKKVQQAWQEIKDTIDI